MRAGWLKGREPGEARRSTHRTDKGSDRRHACKNDRLRRSCDRTIRAILKLLGDVGSIGPVGTPAARLTDMHVCPMVTGIVPHVGGPIVAPGCPTVLVQGLPAARVGDMLTCVGPPDTIAMGSTSVLIGSQPAARLGDTCAHGGTIILGCFTVLVG